MTAYRTAAGANLPRETIVMGGPRRRWTLAFALPFLATFDHKLMYAYVANPYPPHGSDDFCGNPYMQERMEAFRQINEVRSVCLLIAVVGIALAISSLPRSRVTVVVDRAARVLRVISGKVEQVVSFADRPILVLRDGTYVLHAGARPPIVVGWTCSPRRSIDRLRAALATLDRSDPR